MTTRDTIEGILKQWAEAHGGAAETPQALLDAYRAEVLGEAADAVEALHLHPNVMIRLAWAYSGVATLLRRMAAEPPASQRQSPMS